MLVEHWQHSFDHNGKHVQHMAKIWRFALPLLPVAAQATARPRELTLPFVLLPFSQLLDKARGQMHGLVMGTIPCCDLRKKGHFWEGQGWEAGWQWGTLPSPAGPGVRSGLGLGLELAAFGPLCNAGQLEGFTFQRGKENVKN